LLPPDRQKEKKPADWGEVFTTLLCHTNMNYEEIGERTLPQIIAIVERLEKHIGLKIGVPVRNEEVREEPAEEHTVEDAMRFVSLFAGVGD
jgi:protein gp37